MSFTGVVLARIKGKVAVKKTERDGKDRYEVVFTGLVSHYDWASKERKYNRYTFQTAGRPAEIAKDLQEDDDVVLQCYVQKGDSDELEFFVYNLKRLGDEGANVHWLAGAVENVDLTFTDNGEPCAKISLRTPYKGTRRDSGEEYTGNHWHRLTAWGRRAETIDEYLGKDEDNPELRKWAIFRCNTKRSKGKNSEGEESWYTNITVDSFEFTGVSSVKYESQESTGSVNEDQLSGFDPDDGTPF